MPNCANQWHFQGARPQKPVLCFKCRGSALPFSPMAEGCHCPTTPAMPPVHVHLPRADTLGPHTLDCWKACGPHTTKLWLWLCITTLSTLHEMMILLAAFGPFDRHSTCRADVRFQRTTAQVMSRLETTQWAGSSCWLCFALLCVFFSSPLGIFAHAGTVATLNKWQVPHPMLHQRWALMITYTISGGSLF